MMYAAHYGQVCPEEIAGQLRKKYPSLYDGTRPGSSLREMDFFSIAENAHRAFLSSLDDVNFLCGSNREEKARCLTTLGCDRDL